MSEVQANHRITSSPLSQMVSTESPCSNGHLSSILTSTSTQTITDTTLPPVPQEPYFDPEEPRSLIFPEFSFISPSGKIDHLSPANASKLNDYLHNTYNASIIDPHLPYLCPWFENFSEIPLPSFRPRRIAGLVTRWFAMKSDSQPVDLDLDLGERGTNP